MQEIILDERIVSATFDEAFAIMDEAFPNSEMRTYERQRALLSDPTYRMYACRDASGRLVAFLAAWEFPFFRFVEHIAVSATQRGAGLGGRLMEAYKKRSDLRIVLEVEPPENEIAQRRIGFYQRHGFQFNHFPYEQPPMREGQQAIALYLMSWPEALSEEAFHSDKATLYRCVYGQEEA